MATNLLTFAKLLALTVALNIVRYVVGGVIEGLTIMEPMHAPMAVYPEVFNNDFGVVNFALGFFFNFVMWFAVVLAVHMMWPALKGSAMVRAFKGYAAMWLFFGALAAVYMNHYLPGVQPFYRWSIIDAMILFPLLAAAHGFFYPMLFKGRTGEA